MAITLEQLFRKAKARHSVLRGDSTKPFRSDDFERALNTIIGQRLLPGAWGTLATRQIITKPGGFPITFISGAADISGITDLWIDSLDEATIKHPSYRVPFYAAKTVDELYEGGRTPDQVKFYCIGQQILTRDDAGANDVVSGVATIVNAAFIPTVNAAGTGTLPAGLEDELVELMAKAQLERPGGGGAQ